jgi:predicted phosphatase
MRKIESGVMDNCLNQVKACFGQLQAALEEARNAGYIVSTIFWKEVIP